MSKIVLARVDDRLIHGQVMTAWLQYTEGDHIVIIDDATAKDDFLKSIMSMSVPQGIKLDVLSIADGVSFLKSGHGNDKLLLLAKMPSVYLNLVDAGVKIGEVVIGGMGANPQRKKFYKNISASEEEKKTMQKLIDAGVSVKIQIVPSDGATDVKNLLK
ncbi:PTS sugar transporter subunit IIB [Lacticaseibacillus rhamnosus]|uniref:PTS sugar transporter subunit IIB n=1 Tax=Lacticaseibacillus rhamnosus TaxID=47715 RepID=UPI0007E04639|nr:PTS sugar transporter subunit IIB [Lacticaseibacillus rhamnosus]MBB1165477.1 PTS sugar transporter subunit IIB [Lacticaseibacillus rhamnosus]MCZ2731784.1 PTS sugar transporter subunit IIB [Lacticaseibacillus rhamnosus]MCZ2734381.1 PTS sugar transporter subunit IIB [Lacticaseibacillus rhamnosus]MCZ2740519.1 PTS sugar transporter subunit IIB [Lacticaseibacillus rhamnosus]MCZ2743543.1 PTS sugar transporter subunit IIB [Lacticaseibacillus rhamnosus]